MSNSPKTFVSACLSGTALLDDVDEWVETWHESPNDVSLDDYLGFSAEEGALWAERPESLRFIVAAHRYGKPVETILQSRDDFALAARASDSAEAMAVLAWLRQTNRL
ncbi:hypothetical protein QFZ30_002156 [Arthrobacter pascens]|uniref:hypothetical protein n=1 Tax=Arthrobacter pascens TaxID=1677 RepID=UPI00278F085B|nr:hypothetical protein [Arthrobacter pascens]MDQ0678774.1 hypothetical protein [Arthrobacter pascens]